VVIPSLETTYVTLKSAADSASTVFQNYKSQVASIQEELQGYQNTSTMAGREVEVLTTRVPALQSEYDDAMDRYTEVESSAADKQADLAEAMRSLAIETRYKEAADNIVARSDRISTLNDVFRRVAEERVKETDLRAARTALSELLADRRDQLQKLSDSIAGSTGPDLTDETYVALTERMDGLNKILDEDYDAFYGVFSEYETRFPIYEITIQNVEDAEQALLTAQNRVDNGEADATMLMAVATAEKQLEKNRGEEQMARSGLEHIAEQLNGYIEAFEKNRDIFVPAETQAATEAAIRTAAAGPS
jgi:archaellum component FlaC